MVFVFASALAGVMAGVVLESMALVFAAQRGLLPGLPCIAAAEIHLQKESGAHKAGVLLEVPIKKKILEYWAEISYIEHVASREMKRFSRHTCTPFATLPSIINAGSITVPPRAGSMGMSSTLLIGVPYSWEVSRSTSAFGGKAKPLIMHP